MARWHGLWMTPAQPPDIERELNIERLLATARHQPLSAAAHSLVSLMLAGTLLPAPPRPILIVLALIQVAAAIQLAIWWRHRYNHRPSRVTDRTMTRLIAWSLVWGALWGFYGASLMASVSEAGRAPIAVAIVGMTAGGVNMLMSLPAAVAAFVTLMVLPPAWVAAATGDRMGLVLGFWLAISAAFLVLSGRRNYLMFLDHLRLRLGISRLADDAEAASRAKSRFLANMSHELRTPLNAIIGFAEMIHAQVKGPVSGHYAEFARAIEQSGRHLVAIINDILDLSKIQAGSRDLDESCTTVAAVVDRAAMVMQPVCAAAEMRLEIDLAEDLPEITVDARRLSQVLINLLSNAVKFSAPGSTVRLEGRLCPPHGRGARAIVIRVIDRGIGIPADEVQEVLKPFVQSREAERRQTPGTGLGLPLADEIMRLHGGSLTLASKIGEGTTVTVMLPLERSAAVQNPELSREIAS
jgi:signal transduction histidine kinase